jgi:hypothetical protein
MCWTDNRNKGNKMANGWLWALLHGASAGENFIEVLQRIRGGSKPSAEEDAAKFGAGFGDEHDYARIMMKLSDTELAHWVGIVDRGWPMGDDLNFAQKRRNGSDRARMMQIIASMDRVSEVGTRTKKIEVTDGQKKTMVEEAKKILSGSNTKDAVTFIKHTVKMLDDDMKRAGYGTQNQLTQAGFINPAWEETRNYAIDGVLRYLKQIRFMSDKMPLPGEKDKLININHAMSWVGGIAEKLSTEEGRQNFIIATEQRAQQPESFSRRIIRRIMFGK